jgi:hypothetical protein
MVQPGQHIRGEVPAREVQQVTAGCIELQPGLREFYCRALIAHGEHMGDDILASSRAPVALHIGGAPL